MRAEKRITYILTLLLFIAICHNTKAWSYEYSDSFDTEQAMYDSISHSMLWPETAYPPAHPYLFYSSYITNGQRTLVFMDSNETEADISYCLPLKETNVTNKSIKGYINCRAIFPFANQSKASLKCRVSPTGEIWSSPVRLTAGQNQIPFFSFSGKIYVQFIGKGTALDDLYIYFDVLEPDIIVPEHYETIQDAINNATDGQTIEVMPGKYSGTGNCNLDTKGKAITIRSEAGPDETIIVCKTQSGNQLQRGFYFHNGETAQTIIQGFTIINGNTTSGETADLKETWNSSESYSIGGGIFCEYSSPTISNCIISNCEAQTGGGIGCVGGKPTIYNCIIEDCSAEQSDKNIISAAGGGIALLLDCSGEITDSRIRNNKCGKSGLGGAIYSYQSSPHIYNTTICDNNLSDNIKGGGISLIDSYAPVIRNCLIYNNAAISGGAIFIENTESNDCIILMANCTVADNYCINTEDPNACGIIQISSANYSIQNSIIWNKDYKQLLVDNEISCGIVEYCNILNGYDGTNNIATAPGFAVSDSDSEADYHLLSTEGRYDTSNQEWTYDQIDSPCIDAGKPTRITGFEPWPNGLRSNIGAYGQTKQASKSNRCKVYHVDGTNGLNTNGGESCEDALRTIAMAIRYANDTDMILIWPGEYSETINPLGKKLLIQSAAKPAIITPDSSFGLAFFNAEEQDTSVRNLIIKNCTYAIYCTHTSPTLANLTVVNNQNGLVIQGDSIPYISNTIFWDNNVDIFCDKASGCDIRYSRFDQDRIQIPTTGDTVNLKDNIYDSPLYTDASIESNDYTLPSKYGHFSGFDDPNDVSDFSKLWINDNMSSPCVDAGDPYINPVRESMPNGGRINIGAHGGTIFASRNPWSLLGDFDHSGLVDISDFSIISKLWMTNQTVNNDGILIDHIIDIEDLIQISESWLGQLPWNTDKDDIN